MRYPRARLAVRPLEDRTTPATLFGLTDNNLLIRFDSANPGFIDHAAAVNGLQPGERLVGIDFRPRTGQLFGVGVVDGATDTVRLYTLNPLTGAASVIPGSTPFTVTSGTIYGVDFNPTSDRIRVVNDGDENFRINPNTGARSDTPTNDTDLSPVGNQIRDVAYDRSFENGIAVANRTTLFGIGAAANTLITVGGVNQSPSPNGGAVMNAKPLGVTIAANTPVGFDIPSTGSTGLATFTENGSKLTGLYSINLGTGAATLVGTVGNGVIKLAGLAVAPESRVVAGSGPGVPALVHVFDGFTHSPLFDVSPYGTFRGGVRVATGDVNFDGVPDVITAPGPGSALPVKAFSGVDGSPIAGAIGSLTPFGPTYRGGIQVAAGDVNGDGFKDVIVTTDPGVVTHVKVISGATGLELVDFAPFASVNPNFRGGARVAAADFDRDGDSEIVVASGRGIQARVRVFDGSGNPFLSIGLPSFNNDLTPAGKATGGVYVAAGDVDGDGVSDLIVGDGSGRHLRTFSGVNGSLLADVVVPLTGGIRVATADFDGDGRVEVVASGGPGRRTEVRTFAGIGLDLLHVFNPFGTGRNGAYLAGSRV
jgi:hypothetical protein